MKPLFTVHAGEYLVGSHIEHNFKKLHVWVPSKDTGIDLLVSDSQNRRTLSLQVKFSKDFSVTHVKPAFRKHLRACGWWTINRDKLQNSKAALWVFVLIGFAERTIDYVVVPRQELQRRLRAIHGSPKKIIQTYLWITKKKRKCWETRDLTNPAKERIVGNSYREPNRDFSKYLMKKRVWPTLAHLK
jgi:hypothetical protein